VNISVLSDSEKKAVIDLARGLVVRASTGAMSACLAVEPEAATEQDAILQLAERVESLTRQVNAQFVAVHVSLDRLHRQAATISGELDAIRQTFAAAESRLDDKTSEVLESASIFVERMSSEIAAGVDRLSSVSNAALESRDELVVIALNPAKTRVLASRLKGGIIRRCRKLFSITRR
jgi:hypothetical protein